jgi:uncharacterized membrane protein (TIGR02234 family)
VSRLARKGPVVLLAVLAAGGLLVAGFRPWVSGVVDDPVLGATRIEATGAQVAPGLSALALALAAAAVAVVATGRVARVVALVAWAGALVTAAVLTGRVLADPSAALGPAAAARVGRTGSVESVADATAWPWVALAAVVVSATALVAAVIGSRRWGGLSSRYESPSGADVAAGPRGERVSSAWDELSAGRDPTDVSEDRPT